jgi:putative transposase
LVGHWYRTKEKTLASAQRNRKVKRTKTVNAKIANRLKDAIHKFSRKLVNENVAIFVGDLSSKAMLETKNAKSTSDASWCALKTMLEYKYARAGVVFEVINESLSSQVCSGCGCISRNSPKGMDGLGIRKWSCHECGDAHDRDVNAAKNICEAEHGFLAEGIPTITAQRFSEGWTLKRTLCGILFSLH